MPYSCEGCGKKMRTPERTITIRGKAGYVEDKVHCCEDCHDGIKITMDQIRKGVARERGDMVVKRIKRDRERAARKKKEREEG